MKLIVVVEVGQQPALQDPQQRIWMPKSAMPRSVSKSLLASATLWELSAMELNLLRILKTLNVQNDR